MQTEFFHKSVIKLNSKNSYVRSHLFYIFTIFQQRFQQAMNQAMLSDYFVATPLSFTQLQVIYTSRVGKWIDRSARFGHILARC